MDNMREVTARERAALLGTDDFLGVPLSVCDLARQWNLQCREQHRERDVVSVMVYPLLKAVYELGQRDGQNLPAG